VNDDDGDGDGAEDDDLEKITADAKDGCSFEALYNSIKKRRANGTMSHKQAIRTMKTVQNDCAYDPVLSTLRGKGYEQKKLKKGETDIIKKYANEIKELTLNASEADRDIYINYLENPDKQIDFTPAAEGNLNNDAKATGIPESIVSELMMYVTTDSGNKGVGMGEFAMSLLFKNISNSTGAGDLSIDMGNGLETFEIKGENATLGKRPDEVNAIDVSNFAKYMVKNTDEVDEKDLMFRKEKRKTAKGGDKIKNILYYKGEEVAKNTFADIMSNIYNNSNDKDGFKEDFKEALRILDTSKKERHSDAIDEFFDDIDFTTPQGIQNGIALLNFYRYIMKEKFQHFLAHDYGKKGNKTGQYVYASGSPLKMVKDLMGVATFQAISPDNLKPRIGFNKSMRENLITKMFY
jgi:hypothetical protein